MPLDIIVVGAGLGGLAAAIALKKVGHTVTVLEKHAAKTEVGFAVSVTPNSAKVLRHLGLDFEKAGMVPWTRVELVRAVKGEPMEFLEGMGAAEGEVLGRAEERYGAPSLAAHRVDLHEALREMCEGVGVKVEENMMVKGFDAENGSVDVERDGVGMRMHADVVVAADGVKSRAHRWILGEERPATRSPLRNVRFTLGTEKFRGILELMIPNEKSAVEMSSLYSGPKKNVVLLRYPCRGGAIQNFGMYEYADGDSVSEEMWRTKSAKEVALYLLEGYNDALREVVRRTDDKAMWLWHVNERLPLPSFHKGRLVILGDAAHPMHPTLGAGAAMAFEDAAVLGVLLKDVEYPSLVPPRLAMYDSQRRPRASAVQLLSQSDSMWYTIPEKIQRMAKEYIPEEEWPELTRPGVNDWIFRFDCIGEAEKALKTLTRDSAVDS